MSRFLITGGAGFVGSHLVEEVLAQGHMAFVLDSLTYAGQLRNIACFSSPRLRVIHHDFRQPIPYFYDDDKIDYVIHNGAESHVLRSLEDPEKFVSSNVLGTLNMLEWAREHGCKKFVYVSTDEVFGPAGDEPFHEGDRLSPTNPYSASKAGGEFLLRSYFRCFGVPGLITRTCNMFGERQNSEKFVPLVVKKLLAREVVDIHADHGEVGSRCWAYAGEQARALVWLSEFGEPGKEYHVSEGAVKSNHDIALMISDFLGTTFIYRLVEYAWPGHDLHYKISVKGTPDRENWRMKESFEELLKKTVLWYRDNPEFLS